MHSYENAAKSFWHHIYTKEVFSDRKYAVDYKDPPITEEQGQRKVDQTVRELVPDWGALYVLLFHVIKRNEISSAQLQVVESQAFTACESYAKKHAMSQVYAQTSVGSRARFFLYKPGTWKPLDGGKLGDFDAYQEFGDADGEKYILEQLRLIKEKGVELPTPTWLFDQGRHAYYYVTPIFYIYQDGTKIKR